MAKFDYFSIVQGHYSAKPGDDCGQGTVLPASKLEAGPEGMVVDAVWAAVPQRPLPAIVPQRVMLGGSEGDVRAFLTEAAVRVLQSRAILPIVMVPVSPDKCVGVQSACPPKSEVFERFVGVLRRLPAAGIASLSEAEEIVPDIATAELNLGGG